MATRPNRGPHRSNHELGAAGERLVAAWYQQRGYRLVARNWRSREGEIDLIVRRRSVLVFCEVKTRSSRRFGDGAEAVTPVKQRRIRSVALRWLAHQPRSYATLRFDVASVHQDRVRVIQGAF